VGENTDGKGLVKDFAFHNVILEGQSILLLGAGGAAKGALPALVDAGPSKLCVYNRTQDKAQDLVSSACAYTDMSVEVFDTANAQSAFDVIINATSLSMRNETPDIPESVFSANTVAYDMVYRDEATAFMKMAAAAGSAKQLDGLGMLIEQAALSFSHWFSKVPDTKILRTQLRK
jgi:shikimate dehydrogenase